MMDYYDGLSEPAIRTPEKPIWVHSSFAGDTLMNNDPDSMWNPSDIRDWGQALIDEGVDGLFLRGYDWFTYDLAYTSFTSQREAAVDVGMRVTRYQSFVADGTPSNLTRVRRKRTHEVKKSGLQKT